MSVVALGCLGRAHSCTRGTRRSYCGLPGPRVACILPLLAPRACRAPLSPMRCTEAGDTPCIANCPLVLGKKVSNFDGLLGFAELVPSHHQTRAGRNTAATCISRRVSVAMNAITQFSALTCNKYSHIHARFSLHLVLENQCFSPE